MEKRIEELEIQAAYQAKLLSELDEVLQEFGKSLGTLEKRVRRLEDAHNEHREEMEPHNTPPPHY